MLKYCNSSLKLYEGNHLADWSDHSGQLSLRLSGHVGYLHKPVPAQGAAIVQFEGG